MPCLTFSSVDNPEIPVLLHVLRANGGFSKALEVKEVVGRSGLSLDGETCPRKVILALSSFTGLPSPKAGTEETLAEQWLAFAFDTVAGQLKVAHDLDNAVLGPLHFGLERRTFLTGSTQPLLVDWLLFTMLAYRLSGITGCKVKQYYRVVRWAAHLGHLLERSLTAEAKKTLILPATIDVAGLEKAMKGLEIKPVTAAVVTPETNGKPVKAKKGQQQQAPAPIPVASHPFARADLRVGKIIKAERHPAADRLYIETVDIGEESPRTVVSGLVEHVPIEELQDRFAIFVCNLKPATLCKTLSTAMLLVAKNEDGSLEPLIVPAGAKPGDQVTIEGVIQQPDAVIKPKEDTWEKVRLDLAMRDGVAYWTDKELCVAGGKITSTKVSTGTIS